MKKLSRRHRTLLIYRSKKVLRLRTLLNARFRKLAASSVASLSRGQIRTVSLYRDGQFENGFSLSDGLAPPADISLGANYEETALFLQDVRGRLAASWQTFVQNKSRYNAAARRSGSTGVLNYYDYTKIERMSVSSALVLASEYDCLRKSRIFIPKAIDFERWQPNVRALLEGIGFLEMSGVHSNGPKFTEFSDLRILRFRSGAEADGEQVEKLLTELGVPQALEDPAIYDAIIEALVNTRHHAYPKGLRFPRPHFAGWWLTALVDHRDRRIVISTFDRGLGIPATLPHWERYPAFQRGWRRIFSNDPDLADTSQDGMAIRVAMAVGKSSTGYSHRGRGLPAMESVIDLCLDGSLTIYSRCGEYRRSKGGRPQPTNRNTPVGGTLVTWDLAF
ncbi:hypothetical protein [Methylobacterium pseudosasicola]|uniref:Uncharacterized protein n=1 Tax=Methylobacterium pseudosasicola TaxID=582667 RepID=A0A1I4N383_9HYPH|nr:hypothetical protein [Methylobacterium pseudosasicola]SFM10034.1 hypothetical protein SAMN05192568_101958 [Methylobacterium pseudosasicola]